MELHVSHIDEIAALLGLTQTTTGVDDPVSGQGEPLGTQAPVFARRDEEFIFEEAEPSWEPDALAADREGTVALRLGERGIALVELPLILSGLFYTALGDFPSRS